MITITMGADYTLTADSNIIPAQHSANVPFKFKPYTGYENHVVTPCYIYYDGYNAKSGDCTYDAGSFSIPLQGFSRDGMLGISFALYKDGIVESTELIEFTVRRSAGSSTVVPGMPDGRTWQEVVDDFTKQLFNTLYEKTYEEGYKQQFEEALEQFATDSSQQLSENEHKLNDQLAENDTKVDAQIAEVQDALEKKSTEVDNRLGDLQTLYDTVEEKLSNGDFVGQQGPQGIPGPKGDKGDPGENGVITEISSFFTLSVDSNGDLWVSYSDNDRQPPLEYNDEEGNLYWVTEEDRGEV